MRIGRRWMWTGALVFMVGPAWAATGSILDQLGIAPSAQSIDYVQQRKQFQLQSLVTEQRHPKTMDLSYRIAGDTAAGVRELLSVDQDVTAKLTAIIKDPAELGRLQDASKAIQRALRGGHRIYVYGTCSTGRLAETIESGLWRPYWQRLAKTPLHDVIDRRLPRIGERLGGEITGGDRALISSLEGFEDLQLIGRLQLQEHAIGKDDVVFAVTEGGETSAVIGTALAAAAQADGSSPHTFFVYNNPDRVLLPFERSRQVLTDPRIEKINLTTGPQAIGGSTRMQATTVSLYVLGAVLEDAVQQVLGGFLPDRQLALAGLDRHTTLVDRLQAFSGLQRAVAQRADAIAAWTDREAATYAAHRKAIYLAQDALLPVFVDVTERAPTFRLAPLDPVGASPPKSWIAVQAPVSDAAQAWMLLLHRPFHGLDAARYGPPFREQINDPYLRAAALRSLAQAGSEQQRRYDLSLGGAAGRGWKPQAGDLGVLLSLGDERELPQAMAWLQAFRDAGTSPVM